MHLVDSSFINNPVAGEIKKNLLEVKFNNTFGARQLKQKRKLLINNFEMKHIQESVKMKVLEGAGLSVLGLASFDLETGQVKMDQLAAVIAGGVSEAKKWIETEI